MQCPSCYYLVHYEAITLLKSYFNFYEISENFSIFNRFENISSNQKCTNRDSSASSKIYKPYCVYFCKLETSTACNIYQKPRYCIPSSYSWIIQSSAVQCSQELSFVLSKWALLFIRLVKNDLLTYK